MSSLLKDFTSNRRQIAIVLDEYGGTEGMITLEDILEEIVGDYEDEFSQDTGISRWRTSSTSSSMVVFG